LAETLALLSKPVPLMQEAERQDLRTGLSLSGGISEAYRLGGTALRRADELEAVGTRIAQACAHRIRFTYYVVRGMRERAEEQRRELDIHGLSGGTTWQVEWFALPIEGMTNARFGDLVIATQALARLERLAGEIPALARPRDMLRIGNHVRRGEYARAIELGQEYVAHHPPGSMVGWGTVYAVLAAALNHSERYAEARALCERAFAALTPDDLEYDHMYGGLVREHAVACAGTGEVERALAISEQYTSRLETAGEYALLAYALECRARLAQMTSDHALLEDALSAMREASQRSGSEAVVAQVGKLIQAILRAMHTGGADHGIDAEFATESTSSVATPPRGIVATRQHTLLRRVMQQANARAALVLLWPDDGSAPRVTAATGESVPLEALAPVLQQLLQQMASAAPTEQTRAWPLSTSDRAFQLIALPRRSTQDPCIALMLERGEEAGEEVPPSLLMRLSERIRSELAPGSQSSDHVLDSSSSHSAD
jgi:tetratricopeptide (TPR) repeat protein